jgi:hypothetical protein
MTDKTEAMDNLIAQDADLIEICPDDLVQRLYTVLNNPTICREAADRIEAQAAEIERLKNKLSVDTEPSPYCPICGSCGDEGCCGSKRCMYPAAEWQPIEMASKSEMILGHADGMVRLVMWESGRWVQVGVTIEAGWFEPTEWKPIGALEARGLEIRKKNDDN